MTDTVIVTESVSDVIITTEETTNQVVVTEPSGTDSVTVTEQPESVLVTQEAHPVSVYISHGGSAYIDAVNQGFVGTEVDWINAIFDGKADKSYVDGLFVQSDINWQTALDGLEANIAATYATKIELSNLLSWVTQQIALYDIDVKDQLSQYALKSYVVQQIDLANGYMIQAIDTLEANLGTNAAIIETIQQVVATESEARSTQIDNLEANFALSYATIQELNTAVANADMARSALSNTLTTSFNNRIDAEVFSLQEAISGEAGARASAISSLTANYNNLSVDLTALETVVSDETQQRATAIQSLTAMIDQNYQAQSTLIQDVDTQANGNSTAIAGFRTAITGEPLATQTQAEVGLESIRSQAGDAYSRAYMTVSNTVGGVTYVTGITADSSDNSLAFMADSMSIRDASGNPQLYWDASDQTWIFKGRLIIGGNVVDDIDDIGDIATPVHYIKPLNGIAIKNGVGSLTLEARTAIGSNNFLSTDGYLRTTDNPTIDLGNTTTFTGSEINEKLVVELIVAGQAVDSVTLIDIFDGENIVGEVISERIAWVQDEDGNWPTDTNNTVVGKFYKNGSEIASGEINLNLQEASGFINGIVTNESDVTASFIGNGTNQVTVKFTHTLSGQQVTETFFSVFKGTEGPQGVPGTDGVDGVNGIDGTDGNSVAIIYAMDSSGTDQSFIQGSRKFVNYYEYTTTVPTLPVTASFVRFIGEDGQSAKAIWTIYADSSNGANQAFDPIGKTWVTFYESHDQPTLPVSATFVKYVGDNGIDGSDGADGTDGVDGQDGTSVLVVYAVDADGDDQSLTPESRKFINYYEYTGAPPTLPVSATFVQFIGDNGEAGQSIWPVYADDNSGTNQSFDPTDKEWVTFHESTTQPTLPITGTFVRHVGQQGGQGPQGPQGQPGTNGVDGTDGKSVAIIYADDAVGTNQSYNQGSYKYICYYEYTGTEPTLPVTATFVRFIGEDGKPAKNIWPIYADNSGGANQSFDPTAKTWVTFYESVTQPSLPITATFVKYIGEDGTNGVDGTDGVSVMVVYAQDASGADQSLVAGSRRFITYHEYSGAQPSLPVSTTFVEFIGTDGTPGQSIWPVYADDSDGSNQSFDPTGKEWVTFYESTTQPSLPITATFVQHVGQQGPQGPQGLPGNDGLDGTDGESVAVIYADDANGTNQSYSQGSHKYICYYEYTGTKPTLPVTATFVRFIGEDGAPAYNIWPIYADNEVGSNQSFNPTGKTWITFYESVSQPNLPVSATFVKYIGEDGSDGTDGVNGTDGSDGSDGVSVMVVFAEDAAGNNQSLTAGGRRFINYYEYTGARPTLPISTTFVEFIGTDGSPGQSIWPIYADDESGTNQSFDLSNKTWVTFYESTTQPTLPVTATFVKHVGIDGQDGQDGQTTYTWIRYADTATGAGIDNDPSGKEYIGFAYNKLTPVESDNASDYTWSLIKGTDGVQGPPGDDGQTTYTWVAYSDNSDGSGMYQTPNNNTVYIGIATNQTTATESSNPNDYVWSRFRGSDGQSAPGTFNEYFNSVTSLSDWVNHSGGGERSLVSDSYSGGTALKIGNNSGNDQAWLIHKDSIPYDPTRTYKMRVIAKRTEGTGTAFFGVAGRNATDTAWVNGSGSNTYTSQHYVAGSGINLGSSFTVYEGIFGNEGMSLNSNAKYFRPMLLANYDNKPGTAIIDSCTIEVLGEKGADGSDGADGANGAGFYSKIINTNKPSPVGASYLNDHFRGADVANRNPVFNDVFFVTWNNATDAYQYLGPNWTTPSLVVNGSIVASGTLAGDSLIAGTSISSPVIKGGSLIGASVTIAEDNDTGYFTHHDSVPFGVTSDLVEWFGPKVGGVTWNNATNTARPAGMSKINAKTYKTKNGDVFFGGTFQAGTLSISRQTTNKTGALIVDLGTFTIPGGTTSLAITASVSGSGSGLGVGMCPTNLPSFTTTVDIERYSGGTWQSISGNNGVSQYQCSQESQEAIISVNAGITTTTGINVSPGQAITLRAVAYTVQFPRNFTVFAPGTGEDVITVDGSRSLSIAVSGA